VFKNMVSRKRELSLNVDVNGYCREYLGITICAILVLLIIYIDSFDSCGT
jgi:hypothetical protein